MSCSTFSGHAHVYMVLYCMYTVCMFAGWYVSCSVSFIVTALPKQTNKNNSNTFVILNYPDFYENKLLFLR